MKKLTACLIATCLGAALLTGCDPGEKKIELRYKFADNLQLHYNQEMKRTVEVRQADSIVEQYSATFKTTVRQTVEEVRDDSSAIVREYANWRYTRPNKDDSARVDSVFEERTIIYRLKPDGDILDVRFVDEIDASRQSYIRNYLEQGMPVFPEGELSPGFSWTQSAKVIMPDETMEASTTYQIKSLVREMGYDCAVIEFAGNLIIPLEASPEDSVKHSGINYITTSGRMYFAYKEGMVVLQRERWVIDGERTVLKPGEEKPSELKIAVESDIDYVLKERTFVE